MQWVPPLLFLKEKCKLLVLTESIPGIPEPKPEPGLPNLEARIFSVHHTSPVVKVGCNYFNGELISVSILSKKLNKQSFDR